MLKVKFCCCGCSLLVGTMIFLWYGLVIQFFRFAVVPWDTLTDGSFLYAVVKFLFYILRNFIYLGTQIIGIFATGMKMPEFLIPVLISEVVAIVIAIFILVALIINRGGVLLFLSDQLTNALGFVPTSSSQMVPIMALYYLVTIGYNFYSFVVMFSFYKELEEDRPGQPKEDRLGQLKEDRLGQLKEDRLGKLKEDRLGKLKEDRFGKLKEGVSINAGPENGV